MPTQPTHTSTPQINPAQGFPVLYVTNIDKNDNVEKFIEISDLCSVYSIEDSNRDGVCTNLNEIYEGFYDGFMVTPKRGEDESKEDFYIRVEDVLIEAGIFDINEVAAIKAEQPLIEPASIQKLKSLNGNLVGIDGFTHYISLDTNKSEDIIAMIKTIYGVFGNHLDVLTQYLNDEFPFYTFEFKKNFNIIIDGGNLTTRLQKEIDSYANEMIMHYNIPLEDNEQEHLDTSFQILYIPNYLENISLETLYRNTDNDVVSGFSITSQNRYIGYAGFDITKGETSYELTKEIKFQPKAKTNIELRLFGYFYLPLELTFINNYLRVYQINDAIFLSSAKDIKAFYDSCYANDMKLLAIANEVNIDSITKERGLLQHVDVKNQYYPLTVNVKSLQNIKYVGGAFTSSLFDKVQNKLDHTLEIAFKLIDKIQPRSIGFFGISVDGKTSSPYKFFANKLNDYVSSKDYESKIFVNDVEDSTIQTNIDLIKSGIEYDLIIIGANHTVDDNERTYFDILSYKEANPKASPIFVIDTCTTHTLFAPGENPDLENKIRLEDQ